ncbi:hypothetical protein FACS1894116_00470 [Betaproteobacteria bacterium]|nr:hypothetical protein FACS1894116_00470 [Betaproteobacteria bacterium]
MACRGVVEGELGEYVSSGVFGVTVTAPVLVRLPESGLLAKIVEPVFEESRRFEAGRLHLISIFFNNPENPHSLIIKQSRELSSQTQTEFARRHWLLLDYVED